MSAPSQGVSDLAGRVCILSRPGRQKRSLDLDSLGVRGNESVLNNDPVSRLPLDYEPLLERMRFQDELRRLVENGEYEQVIVCDHLVVPLDDRCESQVSG